MSFMGSLSSYITPAVQAAGGIEQGKLQSLVEKIKLDKQARDEALKTALGGMSMRNSQSEIDARENPKGFHFDQEGNAYTMGPDGHLKPVTIDNAPPASGAPATPAAATGGPPGDINLGAPQQGAPAPPQQGVQGAQPATPKATPKFGPKGPNPASIPGTPENLAAVKAQTIIRAKYGPQPEPSVVQGVTPPNPDGTPGTPQFFRVDKRGGDATPIGGLAPKPATGATGGLAMMMKARFGMSRQDMLNIAGQLDRFENDVLAGKREITPWMQAQSAASQVQPNPEAKGALGVLNNASGSFLAGQAGKNLSRTDPEYATYEKMARQAALALTEILPRPTQQLLQMERGVTGIDAGWNPGLLQAAQQRRRAAIEQVFTNPKVVGDIAAPTTQTSGPAKTADPTAGMSDADAWEHYRKAGLTPAQATAKVQSRKK